MSVTFKDKKASSRVNPHYITFKGGRALAEQFAAEINGQYRENGYQPKRPIRVAVLPTLTGACKVLVPAHDGKISPMMQQAVASMSDKLSQKIECESFEFSNGGSYLNAARASETNHYTVRAL